ncbi:MAG: DUF4391 domain-containing protein [Lachnospiraceae bacterium]|nr:DUF4391 domain-containing protein [Lachnospiraceae bacterium]
MIGLPKSTEFNKRIPKQKFYENLTVTPALKTAFKEQVKVIYWRNKIAATTMNLAPGTTVTEVEVFEIRLSTGSLDEAVLRQIDKEIPYHILFLLEYEGKFQAWIGYKEAAQSGNSAFKVTAYYHTDWLAEDALGIKADGLNVDAVYESLVRQIAGDKLQTTAGESLEETEARAEKRKQLQKQIDALQAKIRKEKQLNRQMEMNAELKRRKKEMEEL